MKKSLPLIALAATFACASAFAAERDQATVVVRDGAVTSSSGGAFSDVAKGQELREGDRLMLVDGASATLRFDNGCRVHYAEPGVFIVPDRDGCAALLPHAGGVDWAGAAKITAGVVVAAALLDSMDTVPPPPVSR